MLQFVPLTDELLYATNGPPAPLVPYRCGLPCLRAPTAAPELRDEADSGYRDRTALSGSRSAHRPD